MVALSGPILLPTPPLTREEHGDLSVCTKTLYVKIKIIQNYKG